MLPLVTVPAWLLPSSQHVTPWHWLLVLIPLVAALAVPFWTVSFGGRHGKRGLIGLARAHADTMSRLTGLPGWAASGIGVGLAALLVAFTGFMWDVCWHADFGRDRQLFTVPHVMILLGLAWIFCSGLVAVLAATAEDWPGGLRLKGLRVPYSSLPVLALGAAALGAFPLDDLWHRTYGIDVTMWSPTHLLMIGGASLSLVAYWLMLAEAGPRGSRPRLRRVLSVVLAGAVMIGLSTFQDEFDSGIPQWQLVFQPLLIAAAASVGLVMAREALGRGGAVAAALFFILLRAMNSLLIGAGFHQTVPHFPLYLGAAVSIELAYAWAGSRLRPATLGALAGLLAATFGVATEWAISEVWFYQPWDAALLPVIWPVLPIGVAGGLLGAAMGRVLAFRPVRVPAAAPALAVVAMAAMLGLHLGARQGAPVRADLTLARVGAVTLAPDRDGTPTPRQDVTVDLVLDPATAAVGADWFRITSWEGGSVRLTELVQVAPGHYRSAAPVPTGGSWKSAVFLTRGDVMAGLPIAMPADRQYGQAAVQPESRSAEFVPAKSLLMREDHGGVAWPKILAYAVFVVMAVVWLLTFAFAFRAVSRGGAAPARAERQPSRLRRLAT